MAPAGSTLLGQTLLHSPTNVQPQIPSWSGQSLIVVLNILSLSFVVYHAVTWFNLAPKAMVVHVRNRRVPGHLIAGSNYMAWAVASALVAWLILGG